MINLVGVYCFNPSAKEWRRYGECVNFEGQFKLAGRTMHIAHTRSNDIVSYKIIPTSAVDAWSTRVLVECDLVYKDSGDLPWLVATAESHWVLHELEQISDMDALLASLMHGIWQ